MPQSVQAPSGTDDKTKATNAGLRLFQGGPMYIQQSSITYNSSTTETSLFNGATGTAFTPPATAPATANFGSGYPSDSSSLALLGSVSNIQGPGALTPGCYYKGRIIGTIKTNGTPNITYRLVLRSYTDNTVVTVLATTGATAMNNTATARQVTIDFGFIVTASGTSGAVTPFLEVGYFSAVTTKNFISTIPASVTVDTTQSYYIDVLATWGTSDANNSIVTFASTFSLVG